MTFQLYNKRNKIRNKEVHRFIYDRYIYYSNLKRDNPKKILTSSLKSGYDKFVGSFWGLLDGFMTGLCIGGKWGGNGGWIMGSITQLICLICSPIVFGINGFVTSILSDKYIGSELLREYRYNIGSTVTDSSVLTDSEFFPDVDLKYFRKGNRKFAFDAHTDKECNKSEKDPENKSEKDPENKSEKDSENKSENVDNKNVVDSNQTLQKINKDQEESFDYEILSPKSIYSDKQYSVCSEDLEICESTEEKEVNVINLNNSHAKNMEKFDCKQELLKNPKFLLFLGCYRLKQKISGAIYGSCDGFTTGYSLAMKWGGGGGFIFGGFAQVVGMIICSILGSLAGFGGGIFTDRLIMEKYLKDYRISIGGGGMPPTHDSLK